MKQEGFSVKTADSGKNRQIAELKKTEAGRNTEGWPNRREKKKNKRGARVPSPWASAQLVQRAGLRWRNWTARTQPTRTRSTVTGELLPFEAEAGTGTAAAAGNGSGAAEHGKIGRIPT